MFEQTTAGCAVVTIQLLSGAGRHVTFTYGLDPESLETYSSNFDVALLAKAGKTIELRAPSGTRLPFPPRGLRHSATSSEAIHT
jgi:hypothetical protein